MQLTRRIEFDAGHRLPGHEGKCRNVHGHRYVLEATVYGGTITKSGAPDEGMVIDLSVLKGMMMKAVGDPWDHAFIVYEGDVQMRQALALLGEADHKTVVLPYIPTCENMARFAHDAIAHLLKGTGITLERVRLYETPNCWADWG